MTDRLRPDDPLRELVEEWKASSPAPPEDLELRILSAVRAEREADRNRDRDRDRAAGGAEVIAWRRPSTWPRPAWAAAGALAAMLAIGSMLTVRTMLVVPAPDRADRLLVADALRDAEAAEREHARAIARLEEVAAPILARAADPELPGASAARLASLGNRLRFLDQTIAEINHFLEGNPGHAGARTTLLAAYTEKTGVLRDVIEFDQEISS